MSDMLNVRCVINVNDTTKNESYCEVIYFPYVLIPNVGEKFKIKRHNTITTVAVDKKELITKSNAFSDGGWQTGYLIDTTMIEERQLNE